MANPLALTRTPAAGTVVFLTGLPSAGKTTLARGLSRVLQRFGFVVTILDGDEVRQKYFPELGYSPHDREQNVARISLFAAEIARHGGITICSLVAPYAFGRAAARELVERRHARFVEVYVSTPLAICEGRDVKGLYASAKRGETRQFTGVDAPYEVPMAPDLALDTSRIGYRDCIRAMQTFVVRRDSGT